MKKICLFVCVCLLVALALVACDKTPEQSHTHTYADDWSYDEDGHWYAATCEHTDEKANVGMHVDEENDGVCDVCGYGSDHEHTYAEAWSSDEQNHWHASACGHDVQSDLGAHKDEDNDDLCDTCSYSGGCMHAVAEQEWQADAEGHWHGAVCGHSVKLEAGEHVDGNNDGACDVCAWSDPAHTHTFKAEYTYDNHNHWYDADCGHELKDSVGAHADADNNGACDTCAWNDGCAHTYSALWSVDGTHHWHDVTCTHTIAPADKAEHVDADNDGACDVCAYLDHEHTYDVTEWVYDNGGHWHAVTCGCSLKSDASAHVDQNNDGACDECAWNDGCMHPLAEAWSSDGTHHWHSVSCSHTVDPVDKVLHKDPDCDGVCNVCGYYDAAHTHTYAQQLTVDADTHYYASTCGHTGARKDEQAHVDDNGDDKCDVCGGYASLQIVIDKATSSASAGKVNGGTITNVNIYHFEDSDEPFVSTEDIFYEFGDGYLHTNDGLYERWFTLLADGTVFAARMIDGAYESESASADNMAGHYFNGSFIYYNVEGYGVESLLYNLYAFAQEQANGGVLAHYNASTGAYGFEFMYYNGYGSLYKVTVDMELTADFVISGLNIHSIVYSTYEEYPDGSFYAGDNATIDYEYTVTVKQTIGQRVAVNDHGPEKFLFASYDFADEFGNLYDEVIYLDPGAAIKLYFANVNPATATTKLDLMNVTGTGNSSQIYSYVAWSGEYVYVKGIAAGTYTLTITTTNTVKTLTIVVGTPALQSITPQIYYKDQSGLYTSTVSKNYKTYAGQTLYFGVMTNPAAASSAFTATVSGGTLGSATITYGSEQMSVSTFTSYAVGTYTVTLTSLENASITTTLTVEVLPVPSVADILSGSYMANVYDFNASSYNASDILVTFAPDAAGATTGKVTITRNGSETEVLSYEFVEGEIEMTHLSGDVLGYTLSLNDQYSVTLGWQYNDRYYLQIMQEYTYTNRITARVWVSAGEMVDNDMYRYIFVFGDQGYAFDGVNSTYPDLLSEINDATGEITVTFLDSVAGTELASIQSITFNPDANTISLVLSDRTVILTPDQGW